MPPHNPSDAFAARAFKPMPGSISPVPAADAAERDLLFSVEQGMALATGENFFRELCRLLARTCGVRWAAVTEFIPERSAVRSLAFWDKDRFWDNFEYPLAHTPCERVIAGAFCHYPQRVAAEFPDHHELVQFGIESYMGVPLLDERERCLGHLYIMDDRPMPPEPRSLSAFRIFAARAAAELNRLRARHDLEQSERRFRAVIDSAMDAVIAIDHDGRIGVFNAAAEKILRCPREQAVGTSAWRFFSNALRERVQSFILMGDQPEAPRFGVIEPGVSARRNDGADFPTQGTLSRVELEGHPLIGMTLRDISEQQQAAGKIEALARENRRLKEEAGLARRAEDILGTSKAIQRVLAEIDLVAPTDSQVLIQGQTGTGKELIAHAIHQRSERRDGPFVKVNCAALPASLVESEFFGHEKGAFTGAVAQRRGRFELADGGTIFLDEVGEVSPEVQVKLLRVLQEHEFERVGGTSTIRVDVRVLAATNRDLARDVESGKFRADLYYRLCVFPISVPALREREGDIALLAEHFARTFSRGQGKAFTHIDPACVDRLVRYPWPGNIRELRNVIERAVILSRSPVLTVHDALLRAPGPADTTIAPAVGAGPLAAGSTVAHVGPATSPASAPASRSLEEVERDHITAVLNQTNWAIAGAGGAAAILGLPASTLRSRMQRLGITRP